MAEKKNPGKGSEGERTFIKGIGFIGAGAGGQSTMVDVKDGKIVRIRPLHYDWKYKPEELGLWEIEARGKKLKAPTKQLASPLALCYKKRVYSPNRILYPLKRVDFDPNGERNIANRGKSGYVRISWDEALDIIVSEINRVREKYGPYAVFVQGDGHGETKIVHGCHGCQWKLLSLLGGYTLQVRNPDSWEGWWWGAKHVWGMEPVGQLLQSNTIVDVAQNGELLLHWGCDAETTTWGWGGQVASKLLYWFTELGIKQIFVCPDLNYSAAVHADKWIPILPNTDAALQLAIAYVWITEDTYDKDFIATHTIGFDKVRDYVLGNEDGIPKTPKWAEPLCGVPSRIIKALAREWAKRRTSIGHCNGGSYIRGPYSTEPARLECVLLGMQAIGRPGVQQVRFIEWGNFGIQADMAVPRTKFMPAPMAAYTGWDNFNPALTPMQMIPKDKVPDAILNPPVTWYGGQMLFVESEYQFIQSTYPMEGCSEVHMIWTDSPSWMTSWNHGNALIDAYRSPKIEFIFGEHQWFENEIMFADIILPVNTKLEELDIAADFMGGQVKGILYEEQCVESLGESKSDYDIACLIAERLGILEEYTDGMSIEERIKFGFDHSGAGDYISFEDFKEKGYWTAPIHPDWDCYPRGLSAFYKDPENNPLETPTGKMEFYSEALATYFPDDEERPPYPKWIPCGETHQESLLCENARQYPLLVVSNHPRWGVHAQHDDVTWFREIKTCKIKGPDGYLYHTVWINPKDAAERGIADGDVVKIYNDRGATLCGAYVTERMMPGVISSDHGAKYDPIVHGELDRGGAINIISPHNTTSKNCAGMATSGYLAEMERANLNELQRQYPEAFQRPFHPTAGPIVDAFLHKEK